METKTKGIEIKTSVTITARQIADQFVAAFEGGSNYWCKRVKLIERTGSEMYDEWIMHKIEKETDYIMLVSSSEGAKKIGYNEIKNGLEILALKYPNRLTEIHHDTGDADTADVFFQTVCFGEVVYG